MSAIRPGMGFRYNGVNGIFVDIVISVRRSDTMAYSTVGFMRIVRDYPTLRNSVLGNSRPQMLYFSGAHHATVYEGWDRL